MKNIIKIIGATLLMIAFSQSSTAQTEIGGGASYFIKSGSSDIGINARANIGLGDKLELTPSMNYIFVSGATAMDFNGDAHYLFGDDGALRFYPLLGANYTRVSASGYSATAIQVNIGGGIKLPLSDNMKLFGEGKYMFGDFDGLAFSAGILFTLGG